MSNNETLADIIAEMREGRVFAWEGCKFEGLADRLEAAAKREIRDAAIEHAVLPAVCITKAPQCNAAALRKVLEEQLRYWDTHVRTRDEEEMRVRTVAALSAPPRNCDVGTPEEQSVRMAEFCRAQYEKVATDVPLCSGCQFNDREGLDCQFAWAQMPYEKGGKE